jgi:hypothetical protein
MLMDRWKMRLSFLGLCYFLAICREGEARLAVRFPLLAGDAGQSRREFELSSVIPVLTIKHLAGQTADRRRTQFGK